jgi:MFS family permease
LEINYFFSQLAVGMASMFGIVFVFRLGGTLTQGLLYLAGFYGCQRLLVMVLVPYLPRLVPKYGFRRLMAGSLICELIKVLLFVLTMTFSTWLLIPAAVFGSLYLAAYELGFHGLFLSDNDDRKIGEQIGWLSIVQNAGLIVAPFLGGLIIDRLGFEAAFLASAVILFVSIIPLFLMPKHKHPEHNYSLARVGQLLEAEPQFSGSVALWYVTTSISEFFWPLYILSLGRGYIFLGGLKSLVMIGSSLSTYGLGKVYDRQPKKQLFIFASLVEASMWLLRFALTTTMALITVDVTGKLMSPVWWMKIRRYELEIGERVEVMVFSVAHELMVSLGLVAGLLIGVWLLVMSGGNWWWLGVPAALGVLLSAWLVRRE